jgi:TonB family protein
MWKYYYRNGVAKMEAEFSPSLGNRAKIFSLNDSTGKQLFKDETGKWIEEITKPDLKNYDLSLPEKFYITENFLARPGIDFKKYPVLKKMNVVKSSLPTLDEKDNSDYTTIYNRPEPVKPRVKQPDFPIPRLSNGDIVYTIVEIPATPPGGMVGFYKSIANNVRYPEQARRQGIDGKVFIEFIVNKDGSLTDFKVLKGLGGGCDQEGIRVLKEYAKKYKWVPATQKGNPVPMRFVWPIDFILDH